MHRSTQRAPARSGRAPGSRPTDPDHRASARLRVRALLAGALIAGWLVLGTACRTPQRPVPPPPTRPDSPAHALAGDDLDVIPLDSGPPMLGPYLEQYPLGNRGRRSDLLASNEARSLHLLQLSLALPPHRRPERKALAYVLTGRGAVVIDGREYPAAPGVAFRVDPGVSHSMHPSEGETLVAIVYYEPPLLDADSDDSVSAE